MNFRSSATGKLTVEIEVSEQRDLERVMGRAGETGVLYYDDSVDAFIALYEGIEESLRALDQ